jgi:hypothetical protein
MLGGGHDGDGLDHAGDADADAHGELQIFSIRNATYFLFGFGSTGLLLSLLRPESNAFLSAAFALTVGLVCGALSAATFTWLRRTQSGALPDDDSLVGLVGEVVLPITAGGLGKVVVERGGREHEMLARPFDAAPEAPETWRTVLIIEMTGGVALVQPYREVLGDDEPSRSLPPNREA